MKPDLDPNTDVSFTRTLAAPRQLIWECWTSPEHIPQFFIPAPHKVTSVDIDLRVGGRFMTAILLLVDAPKGGTTYTAIARHRNPESRKTHEDMGFFDGWGTVATQLEVYAKGLMR